MSIMTREDERETEEEEEEKFLFFAKKTINRNMFYSRHGKIKDIFSFPRRKDFQTLVLCLFQINKEFFHSTRQIKEIGDSY